MQFWVLIGGAFTLGALTLLPLSRRTNWWIRGWDFPRLQLAVIGLLLLLGHVWWLDLRQPLPLITVIICAVSLSYHLVWILPYTRLYPREVRWAPKACTEPRMRLLTANVLTPNRRADAFLQLVRAKSPDVIVTVETDGWWEKQLEPLVADYPHVLRCPLDNLYGMHVYSRLPIEDARTQFLVEDDKPSMHMLVVLPGGRRVRLHCLHPAPPSPTENDTSSERDAELIMVGRAVADATRPVIVTGDLNDVAWSRTTRLFRKVSGLLDPRIGRGLYNTFHAVWPVVRWPVDHIFHSPDFALTCLERLPRFGSDHFAMLVELVLIDRRAQARTGDAPTPEPEDIIEAAETTAAENVDPRDVHRPGERRPPRRPPARPASS